MIKFFRKIRQNLLNQGKTSKYFKYAIGEIVLVVIGILIALQINNWNDKRIQQSKESEFISQIHKEFLLNRAQLDTVTSYHFKGYKATNKILSLIPIDLKSVNLDSVSYFIEQTLPSWTFNPQQTAINSLSNSSTFDIISNIELRTLLQNWNELVLDYQEEEVFAKNFTHTVYLPYYREKIAFINYKSSSGILNYSKVDLNFLTDLEFENLIHNRMAFIKDIINPEGVNELKEVNASIDRIIELTTTN